MNAVPAVVRLTSLDTGYVISYPADDGQVRRLERAGIEPAENEVSKLVSRSHRTAPAPFSSRGASVRQGLLVQCAAQPQSLRSCYQFATLHPVEVPHEADHAVVAGRCRLEVETGFRTGRVALFVRVCA